MAFWDPIATASRKQTALGLEATRTGAVQERSRADARRASDDAFRKHAATTQAQWGQLGSQLAGMGGQAGRIAAMQRALSQGSERAAAAAGAGAMQNARAIEAQTIAANRAAGERQQERVQENVKTGISAYESQRDAVAEKAGQALMGVA